jgi:7,8-dihydropterin-6-yl-methyl-4-(beta-D-ribofuranosyl)aminobenzene 5'-phosphate synthase
MELKILYDNEALNGFRGGFGFSCWVEDKNTLFDTGGDLATLMFNIRKFMINPKDIEKIVLSHEHGDHIGGIQIVDYCGEVDVFVLRSFSKRFKGWLADHSNVRLHEVDKAEEICRDVYTTGVLGWSIKEQSLIVKTCNGLTVVTGCAHPGLENILNFFRLKIGRYLRSGWRLPRFQQTGSFKGDTFNSSMPLHDAEERGLYPLP